MWIESHDSLGDHPKLWALCEFLGADCAQAVGSLHYLWWWCMRYAPDGDITDYPASVIARACRWSGDPGVLLDSLIRAGFVDRVGERLVIHDWADYTGKLLSQRERARERERRRYQASARSLGADCGQKTETCAVSAGDRTGQDRTRQDKTRQDKTGQDSGYAQQAAQPKRARFAPPSLDEMLDYAGIIGLQRDEAEKCYDYYEANGWKVGGRAPMKDWRAALRNWKRNAAQYHAGGNGKRDTAHMTLAELERHNFELLTRLGIGDDAHGDECNDQ